MFLFLFLIAGAQQTKKKRKVLSDTEKYAAYVAMHAVCMSRGGKFENDNKKNIANYFEVHVRTIQRIWHRAMKQIAEGLPVDVSQRQHSHSFRLSIGTGTHRT